MNRFLAAALGLGAAVLSLGGAPAAGGAQAARPPVLLVTVDTLRADAVGYAGGPVATPAIDALAARGVRFDNAVAHAVMTLPSHTSILSGLDPSRHGVHDNTGFRVGQEIETWAERLGSAGYSTGAFVGAFPLDSQFGLAQGFDTYDDYYGSPDTGSLRMVERPADAVVSIARRWLRQQRGPWFAWVHVYDPHAPYLPPPPFDEQYIGNPYGGEVAFTDSALAPLLRDAENRGALVILTSDHGEALGDHMERTHGIFAYASTIRVPLVMAGFPDTGAGGSVADRVSHADILPTVLDALELPGEGTEGASLLSRMRSPTGTEAALDPDRIVYFESLGPNLTRNWAPLRGLFRGRWKYIDLPLPELYDVTTDPTEQADLSEQQGAEMVPLRVALEEHLSAGGDNAQPLAESPETLRRLRALGYVGGGTSGGSSRETFGPEDDPKALIRFDNELQDAILAAEQGDLAGALGRAEAVLAERPDYGAAYLLYANFQHTLGNTEAAVERLTEASNQSWSTPALWQKLAFYLNELGRLDEARMMLEDTLAEEPENVDALILLGIVHGRGGRPEDARRAFARASELDPTYASLHLNQGMLLLSGGQIEQAEAELQRALQFDPASSETHHLLGVIAFQSERVEEALERWRTAVSLSATNFDAMRALGVELVRLNRFAEAVEVLDRLVATVPPALQAEYQIPQLREMVARIKEDHGLQR